jgi:NAD(P)-dependent dehydrogenase (short-subunit alcohol dehydrogenase family)
MTDSVAVVTGATGGIGKEIARGLARLGTHVIVAARTPERGEAAAADISAGSPGQVTVMPLDVAERASIRAFAADLRARFDQLDILVNNAGAWFTDRRESAEGVELTFATNVIGPHLLTELLLDPLRAAPHARVVNIVTSFAGGYEPDDLQFVRRPYDGFAAYGQSKRALTMLTWGLASRLEGGTVTANTVSPGFVRTDFNRNAHGFRAAMINLSARMMGASPAKGADTPLWVATAPELEGVSGKHFEGRKEKEARYRDSEPIADLERRVRELEES